MAAWSIKLINMLRLYIYTQTQEKDTWSMSNVCYSTWHNWLSLVTFCMGFSQHLCRNFWTCSPFIKKVPRLTSEGKYAEAGVPSQWQLLSFLKHSWKKKRLSDICRTPWVPVFDPIKHNLENLQLDHFAKILQYILRFCFHSPTPPPPWGLSVTGICWIRRKTWEAGLRVATPFLGCNSQKLILAMQCYMLWLLLSASSLFLKHLNSDLGIREVCPETHSVNIWAPVTKHEPSARIQWGKRLNQRLPHRACSLMEAIWNSGQVI